MEDYLIWLFNNLSRRGGIIKDRRWIKLADENYRKILEYINYFEEENVDFCTWQRSSKTDDGIIHMGYPTYDEKFEELYKGRI